MKLFYTRNCAYLAQQINFEKGACTIRTFADGEICVQLHESVRGTEVWALAAINPPGDHLLETLFLVDALLRAGAQVNLLITYFGYARQDRPFEGQPLSAQVISNCFRQFKLKSCKIVQVHSKALNQFMSFENIIPVDLFAIPATGAEVIVAPDKGADYLARLVAQEAGLPTAFINKERLSDDEVVVRSIEGDVKDKMVLIVDDMISTGATILTATHALMVHGAASVSVCATHGVFTQAAREKLQESTLKDIYVTNSLPQEKGDKIEILNIAPWLEEQMGGLPIGGGD